jgi:hypothetical protein
MSRPLIKIPGVSEDRARSMSRQERYQLRRDKAGFCSRCGKEKLHIKKNGKPASLGIKCLKAQRERMRDRIDASRRNKNSESYARVAPQAPKAVAKD